MPEQGVHAVALRVGAGPLIELLAPTGADTPVGRFLDRRGEGMHHVAYEVRDIQAHLDRLLRRGRAADRRGTAHRACSGCRSRSSIPRRPCGCLVELVEPKEQADV